MGENKRKKIIKKVHFLCICCFSNIVLLAQTPVGQVRYLLERGDTITSTIGASVSSFLSSNRENITKNDLDTIFEILKTHYTIDVNSQGDISQAIISVYNVSTSLNQKGNVIYFIEQILNDSTIDRSFRGGGYIEGVNLHIFNKKMKDEIVKNLNYTYKNDVKCMLNKYMILLAGALEMTDQKNKLQIIADSCMRLDCRDAARMALCRMGDKKMLKEYFDEFQSMPLPDILERYAEIEYIKQKESIDILLKILYSEETVPAIKETWADEKLAYYAMEAIERIAKDCPIKVQNIYSNDRDNYLKEMREWAKKNKIIINRDIW